MERRFPDDVMFIMHKAEIMLKENDFQNATYYLKKALMSLEADGCNMQIQDIMYGPKLVSPLEKYSCCPSAVDNPGKSYSSSTNCGTLLTRVRFVRLTSSLTVHGVSARLSLCFFYVILCVLERLRKIGRS